MVAEVAITGIGVVSCLGTGADKVRDSCVRGARGLSSTRNDASSGSAAVSPPPSAISPRPRSTARAGGPCPSTWFRATAAAREAVDGAGWAEGEVASERTALIVGNDTSGLACIEQVDTVRREKSTFPIGASLVFQALTSTGSMNLNVLFGNRGASWTLAGACASGGHAIGQAADLIALGRQDRAICGGMQEINWESVASFDATNAFSLREDEPEAASRPFDGERDGLVPGGGAAMVALERMDLAKKRGANILGRVGGPMPFRPMARIWRCRRARGWLGRCGSVWNAAGATPESVSYVCAHATSTPGGRRCRGASDPRSIRLRRPVGFVHQVHDGPRNVDVGRGAGGLFGADGPGRLHRAEQELRASGSRCAPPAGGGRDDR